MLFRPFTPTFAALLLLTVAPALADQVTAPARIERVTVFPDQEQVERVIRLDLPAGAHQVIVPNLPPDLDPETVQVRAITGASLGAMVLRTDRLPAIAPEVTPALAEAERQVAERRAERDAAVAAVTRLQDKAQAARDRLAVLGRMGPALARDKAVDDLPRLSDLLGAEAQKVLDEAHAAEAEARAAQTALPPLEQALARAEADLAAARPEDQGRSALDLSVVATGGPAEIVVTTYGDAAGWMPVYDLHLSTDTAGGLIVDRRLAVSQHSTEDWQDVRLTLSTADSLGRSMPYLPPARARRAEDPAPVFAEALDDRVAGAVMIAEEPPVVSAAMARVDFAGMTALYTYPEAVTLRHGQNALYLPLDSQSLPARTFVLAAPQTAASGFVVARVTNTLAEPLLPGPARLFRDGALIGITDLPALATGAETEIGFGALPAFRLSSTRPDRNEGESGLLTTVNTQRETLQLRAENGTGRGWPVELRVGLDYAEQDSVTIQHDMTPPPDATDPAKGKGQYGWTLDMGPGESFELRIDTRMSWPTGKALR